MAITQRRLTLEEFLKLPEDKPALEFLDGVVTQKMSPKGPHGTLQFEIGTLFDRFVRPRRLARVFTETRVTFAGGSFVPDLIVHRWERVPSDAQGDIPDDFVDPQDIAVEVASPGQTLKNLSNRCRRYVEPGVTASLLLRPRDRSVRLFRADRELGPLTGSDRIDLDDVLPGFELTVDELFRSLRARPD